MSTKTEQEQKVGYVSGRRDRCNARLQTALRRPSSASFWGLVSASARPRSPSGGTSTGRIKPSRFGSSRSSDSNRRTMTLLACLKKYRGGATEDALIFPSRTTGTVDEQVDRVIQCVIDKANQAGYPVKKPKKPCHAFRVLYATQRHQNGVDIEPLRQELGHSDISTTQIYLRSVDRKSDKHRARINELTSSRCCPQAVSLSAAGLRKPPSKCRFGCSQN
jgi:Phage integrase family